MHTQDLSPEETNSRYQTLTQKFLDTLGVFASYGLTSGRARNISYLVSPGEKQPRIAYRFEKPSVYLTISIAHDVADTHLLIELDFPAVDEHQMELRSIFLTFEIQTNAWIISSCIDESVESRLMHRRCHDAFHRLEVMDHVPRNDEDIIAGRPLESKEADRFIHRFVEYFKSSAS